MAVAPGRDLAGELEPDDLRDEHRDGLAEHRGLGLDAADAPAEHAQAVDHRGVAVGADQRVRVGLAVARHDDAGEVLDVDLVHDAGARRDDLELVEGALSPAQELVALLVALVLEVDVALEGVGAAEHVDDHRVVDDQLGGRERVHLRRVAAELGDGLAHRGEVDDAGDAGEVLHDHPGGGELDLGVRLGGRVPAGQRADVVRGDVRTVLGAQQVLQQHLEAERAAARPPRRRTAGRSRARLRLPGWFPSLRSCRCWPRWRSSCGGGRKCGNWGFPGVSRTARPEAARVPRT